MEKAAEGVCEQEVGLDTGCWILDTGYWMLDSVSLGLGSGTVFHTLTPKLSGIWYPGSGILNYLIRVTVPFCIFTPSAEPAKR